MSGGKKHILSPDSAGDMRARDVRHHLMGTNTDPKVSYVLEAFAEKLHTIDKGLGQVALLVDQMADITKSYVGVAERMKQTIDALKGENTDPSLGMLSTEHEGAPK